MEVKANPEALKRLFFRLNTDTAFRASFFEDPLANLGAEISVDREAGNEIVRLVGNIKRNNLDRFLNIPAQRMRYQWNISEEDGVIKLDEHSSLGVP